MWRYVPDSRDIVETADIIRQWRRSEISRRNNPVAIAIDIVVVEGSSRS